MTLNWGDIPNASEQVARALLRTLYQRDLGTFQHSCRVGRYSRLLAQAMGLNEFQQKVLEYSGLFHDIGKIGIPDQVLLKQGRLTEDEDGLMQTHVERSVDLLKPWFVIPFFKSLVPGVEAHHERIDGRGYPFGLKEGQIPLEAKIITVVDAFDAMTESRPYRLALHREMAFKELARCSGTQFDQKIVTEFLKVLPTWKTIQEADPEETAGQIYREAA